MSLTKNRFNGLCVDQDNDPIDDNLKNITIIPEKNITPIVEESTSENEVEIENMNTCIIDTTGWQQVKNKKNKTKKIIPKYNKSHIQYIDTTSWKHNLLTKNIFTKIQCGVDCKIIPYIQVLYENQPTIIKLIDEYNIEFQKEYKNWKLLIKIFNDIEDENEETWKMKFNTGVYCDKNGESLYKQIK